MSKITPITYENFKSYTGKKVEVEITCYAGGIMYPDDNILIGMNEGNYYFVSEQGTEDELFWHHTIETGSDPKMISYIQVWDYIEYASYYNPASKIRETFGYTEMLKTHLEYITEHGLESLDYDVLSLEKIRRLKSDTLTLDTYMLSAYLRDIENEITKGIKQC